MSEEIKFDHFKDINELLEHIDLWYREDDIEYTRWFGLTDLYNLKIYITSLQQKVEQLENMRKEAIKYIKNNKETREHYEPYGTPMGNSNYTTTHIFGYYELLEILNKGDNK